LHAIFEGDFFVLQGQTLMIQKSEKSFEAQF